MKNQFVPRPYAGQTTLPFPYGYGDLRSQAFAVLATTTSPYVKKTLASLLEGLGFVGVDRP